MATICPFADWRPLPEWDQEPLIEPTQVIFHTMVGSLRGTENFFKNSTVIESHFGLGGPTDGADLDGALWQWIPVNRQADANREANVRAISIETSDGGDPSRPWSSAQLAKLIKLGIWLKHELGIANRIIPSPKESGFGWHAMWLNTQYEYPDGSTPFTPSPGKVCPGPVRIKQLKEIVLPAIFADDESEDDMTEEQARQLQAVYDVLFKGHERKDIPIDNLFKHAHLTHDALVVPGTTTAEQAFNLLFARVRNIEQLVTALVQAHAEPPPTT